MQEEALQSINSRLDIRVDYTSLEFTDDDEEEEEEEVPDLNDTDHIVVQHFIELHDKQMNDWNKHFALH